ncbi:RNA polymerase sigma factor [Paenibacillus chartarius]|uniref:RNA polymerase sigma factor n=1 Tax=Paenibacillus chartarius TaxID=747481 RepID=A0ABV6DUT2_9BACL
MRKGTDINIDTKPNLLAGRTAESGMLLPSEADRERAQRALVERARSGDHEAFGELVRMHRAQALGWAHALAQDTYLAEDIVQDALIRAFLHLGSLMDSGRFLPWLHRIVRNQAYTRLRRGGPYAKEQPMTSLPRSAGRAKEQADSDPHPADWGDIDRILFHLSRHAADEAQRRGDPTEALLRQEMLRGLHELLHCLSARERSVFEAHFFGELPPEEIASLLGTSKANVYNLLSRSRAKVQKERIRVSLCLYVQRRAALGLPKRRILAPPPDY